MQEKGEKADEKNACRENVEEHVRSFDCNERPAWKLFSPYRTFFQCFIEVYNESGPFSISSPAYLLMQVNAGISPRLS